MINLEMSISNIGDQVLTECEYATALRTLDVDKPIDAWMQGQLKFLILWLNYSDDGESGGSVPTSIFESRDKAISISWRYKACSEQGARLLYAMNAYLPK